MTINPVRAHQSGYPQDECGRYCGTKWDREIYSYQSIVGQIPFIKGEARFGANVEVGYYDQTQSKLTPHNSVLDELWNDFKLTPEVEIRNRLGAFSFLWG
mgnify:CR=1 FL=1